MNETELSFKNDPKIKDDLIARMDKHIELDNLLQKATGEDGKGCTVWCALNNGSMHYGYNHSAFPSILGLPEWLALLQEVIFEGLSVEDSKQFSSEWVRAIPVGKDLEPVKWKFCAFVLKENIERVLLLDISEELKKEIIGAIKQCLVVHERSIETGIWDESAERSAVSAAWSAARSAEMSAVSAAWSAAMSAVSAAWSDASSAERTAA